MKRPPKFIHMFIGDEAPVVQDHGLDPDLEKGKSRATVATDVTEEDVLQARALMS